MRPLSCSGKKPNSFKKRRNSSSLKRLGAVSSHVESDVPKILVAVRVRPETEKEQQDNFRKVVKTLDERLLVFDPEEEQNDFFFRGKKEPTCSVLKRPNKDLKFAFDRVFDENVDNLEVFENTTKTIIDGLFEGYNCSVFAYGATGAGKTFTMLGSEDCPGIIFYTVMELYKRVEEMADKVCDISVSYLEIYNENIRDLMNPTTSLAVRENSQKGVIVSDLSLHKPKDAEHLLQMLKHGNMNRTQHATDANSESSRSHAIFQVYIAQKDKASGITSNVKVAKMSLIDLAGSERAASVNRQGARLREGTNINKSLLALGNCINALADRKHKGHIPYRDSKLTRLLKDSLGGNCRTVMIAAVSPSSLNYEDTYNTLKYADRAKNIQVELKKNVISVDAHVARYAEIVEDLKTEVEDLRKKLKEAEEQKLSVPKQVFVTAVPDNCTYIHFENCLEDHFQIRNKINKELLDCESTLHQIIIKQNLRQSNLSHVTLLSKDFQKLTKSTAKADATFNSLEAKKGRIHTRLEKLKCSMDENTESLEELMKEVRNSDACVQEKVNQKLSRLNKDLALNYERIQKDYANQTRLMCARQFMVYERLLESVLPLLKHQQILLHGHGFLTNDLQAKFDEVLKQAEGVKEVVWADQQQVSGDLSQVLLALPEFPLYTFSPQNKPDSASFKEEDSSEAKIATGVQKINRVKNGSPHPLCLQGDHLSPRKSLDFDSPAPASNSLVKPCVSSNNPEAKDFSPILVSNFEPSKLNQTFSTEGSVSVVPSFWKTPERNIQSHPNSESLQIHCNSPSPTLKLHKMKSLDTTPEEPCIKHISDRSFTHKTPPVLLGSGVSGLRLLHETSPVSPTLENLSKNLKCSLICDTPSLKNGACSSKMYNNPLTPVIESSNVNRTFTSNFESDLSETPLASSENQHHQCSRTFINSNDDRPCDGADTSPEKICFSRKVFPVDNQENRLFATPRVKCNLNKTFDNRMPLLPSKINTATTDTKNTVLTYADAIKSPALKTLDQTFCVRDPSATSSSSDKSNSSSSSKLPLVTSKVIKPPAAPLKGMVKMHSTSQLPSLKMRRSVSVGHLKDSTNTSKKRHSGSRSPLRKSREKFLPFGGGSHNSFGLSKMRSTSHLLKKPNNQHV